MTASLTTFAESLETLGVTRTRTDAAGARDAVAAVCEPPAVGVALPFEGATLPDEVVTDPAPADLEAARTGVTPARLGIADYGTVVLDDAAEHASLFPERHVAVVAASDVVPDMEAAFDELAGHLAGGASAVLATGPSATADMGELVVGAHGPLAVHVVVLEDR